MNKQSLGTKNDIINMSSKDLSSYIQKDTIIEYWENDGVSRISFINELPNKSYSNVRYIKNAKIDITDNILTISGDEIYFNNGILWLEPTAKINGKNVYFKYENKKDLEKRISEINKNEYEIIERFARKNLFKKQKVYSVIFVRETPLLNKTTKFYIKVNTWKIYGG